MSLGAGRGIGFTTSSSNTVYHGERLLLSEATSDPAAPGKKAESRRGSNNRVLPKLAQLVSNRTVTGLHLETFFTNSPVQVG